MLRIEPLASVYGTHLIPDTRTREVLDVWDPHVTAPATLRTPILMLPGGVEDRRTVLLSARS